jgi:predicted enzyme related to lactoylglutathione lyase
MPAREKHEPGSFSWAEVSTRDLKAASDFYTGLFGWTANENPIPSGGVYITFEKDGKGVAGGSDQGLQEGVPPHWNIFVSVDDAEQAAKKAEAAGGTIFAPAFDVGDYGRMAVFADPTGAVISVWEMKEMSGAHVMGEHGAIIWNELLTNDTAKARDFYTEVFGWTAEESEMPSGTYTVFSNNGRQEAGLMAIPQGMGAPPSWTVYFGHDDTAAGVEKVKELGGQVMMGPDAIPTVGTIAWAIDPTGAVFAFMTPEEWPKD